MAVRLSCACLTAIRNTHNAVLQIRGFKRWLSPTLKTMKRKKELEPQPIILRSALVEWNYKAELFAFSKRLGEDFDYNLLQQACTTREYIISENEKQKAVGIEQPNIDLEDNRGLTESGNIIINNYVSRYLRTVLPRLPEEGIHALQQYLTSDEQLAMIASNLGVNDLILSPDVPPEQLISANVFKAVVAALAESSGIDRGNLFVRDFVVTQLVGKNVNDLWEINNPIELLINIFKRDEKPPVEFRLIGEAGRNSILAAYQVGLYLNKELIGVGFGENISVSKEMAARDVLQKLFGITDTMRPIPFDLKLDCDSSEHFANPSRRDRSSVLRGGYPVNIAWIRKPMVNDLRLHKSFQFLAA